MSDIFVPNKIVEFYHLNNLCVLWFIQVSEFERIKFRSILCTLSCSNLKEKIDVRRSDFLDIGPFNTKPYRLIYRLLHL